MKALGLVAVAVVVGFAAGGSLGGCGSDGQDRILRAREAVYAKKPDQALKEYRLALDIVERQLERDGDAPELKSLQARALKGAADVYYLELRDFRRAAEVYEELIRLCPEAPEALEGRVQLADILRVHFGDARGAIGALTAAVERGAENRAELSYRVAKLYFELGDFEQARLEARRVGERDPQAPEADDAALLEAQALAAMEGKGEDAQAALRSLVERFADSPLVPYALFELGKLRAEAGDREGAIEEWVRALERHPDPQMVQDNIARVRRQIVELTPSKVGRAVLAAAPPAVRAAAPATTTPAVARKPAPAAVKAPAPAAPPAPPADEVADDVAEAEEEAPVAAPAPAPVADPAPAPVHKRSIEAAGGTAEDEARESAD